MTQEIFGKGTDPLTNEVFIKKRNNQKFSHRQTQIRFNNILAQNKRKLKSAIDRVLDKNRIILKTILGNEKEIIKSKDFLLGAGFHFGCLTHNINKEGIIYNCIYDYGYCKLDNTTYKIVRNGTNN